MRFLKALPDNFIPGTVASVIVAMVVVRGAMELWGQNLTIVDFIGDPTSVIFYLLMFSLVFSSWFMRGINNSSLVFCLSVGLILHYLVYWGTLEYFYYQNKNIYMLSFLGTAAALPFMVLLIKRQKITIFLSTYLYRFDTFRSWSTRFLENTMLTDFESQLRQVMTMGLSVEFLNSIYMFTYALVNNIPHDGQVYQTLETNGHWDPYYTYMWAVNLVSCFLIAILVLHTYRGFIKPDAFLYKISNERKEQIYRELIKRRAKKRE